MQSMRTMKKTYRTPYYSQHHGGQALAHYRIWGLSKAIWLVLRGRIAGGRCCILRRVIRYGLIAPRYLEGTSWPVKVLLPLIQGMVWSLALHGWRYWNRSAQLSGNTVGAKIRRWWYKTNNWKLPESLKNIGGDKKLAADVGDVSRHWLLSFRWRLGSVEPWSFCWSPGLSTIKIRVLVLLTIREC
jgi:hypothetical protein